MKKLLAYFLIALSGILSALAYIVCTVNFGMSYVDFFGIYLFITLASILVSFAFDIGFKEEK